MTGRSQTLSESFILWLIWHPDLNSLAVPSVQNPLHRQESCVVPYFYCIVKATIQIGVCSDNNVPLFYCTYCSDKSDKKGIPNLPKVLVLVGQLRDGGGLRPLQLRSQSV
jgi:hypothetical protein